MKRVHRSLKQRVFSFDPFLLACTLGLSLISILALLGGKEEFGTHALIMQTAMTVLGVGMVILLSSLDYEAIVEKYSIPAYVLSVILLTATLIFGFSIGSNKSWIEIPFVGISVQPSEFVKAVYIMTFAKHLSMVKDTINKPKTLLALAAHAGIIIGLILLSRDLGVALVYVGITAVMLFCAGLDLRYFLAIILLVAFAFPFVWTFLEPYQQQRILIGFNPDLDPAGYGKQPILGRKAIINGGFFGKGMFGGHYYNSLPVAESDFMFATLSEKFGFVGGFLTIALLFLMVVRILLIARDARKDYGKLICVGVAAMIVLQSFINLGMCLVLLPVIGVTLPFVSAGGSSVLATYIIVGMVHSVRAGKNKYFLET
ncbi:MAG: FtsW/RodA/SpoVE family cell cycle protein [Clostridia bacterium]|nr:FtsW/RodA/SpoVE family cell cycle protein [Clostridia bacterium]